jgi:hypothetical protein
MAASERIWKSDATLIGEDLSFNGDGYPRTLKHIAVVQAMATKVSQRTDNEQVQSISLLESYRPL